MRGPCSQREGWSARNFFQAGPTRRQDHVGALKTARCQPKAVSRPFAWGGPRRFPVLRLMVAFGLAYIGIAAPSLAAIPPALIQYVQSPEHRTAIGDKLRQWAPTHPSCDVRTAQVRSVAIGSAPVEIGSNGRPLSGAWQEVIHMDGCAGSGLLNLFTIMDPQGAAHVLAGLTGSTHADLALEKDALLQVFGMAMTRVSLGCKDGKVTETTFLGSLDPSNTQGAGGAAGSPWHELWTVTACNVKIDEDVTFTPHPGGTYIKAALALPTK